MRMSNRRSCGLTLAILTTVACAGRVPSTTLAPQEVRLVRGAVPDTAWLRAGTGALTTCPIDVVVHERVEGAQLRFSAAGRAGQSPTDTIVRGFGFCVEFAAAAGPYEIQVRRIGYVPTSDTVWVRPGMRDTLLVGLQPAASFLSYP